MTRFQQWLTTLFALALMIGGAGCAGDPVSDEPAPTEASTGDRSASDQRFPDILEVQLIPGENRVFDVQVTVSSPYDTPERYADGWRVLSPDGSVLGEHTLTHDHAAEQPFTRTQPGVAIPDGVTEVTVEGRDQEFGYGGGTVTVEVPNN